VDARAHRGTMRLTGLLVILSSLTVIGCTSTPGSDRAAAVAVAAVCDNMPSGPAQPPPGAVVVDPTVVGDLSTMTRTSPPGTTFWLGRGIYTLGSNEYDQVAPKDGDIYLGAPGAVLDGKRVNRYAFTGLGKSVTIRYLTVKGFVAPPNEGVVNHDSGDSWVIEHNTIEDNGGAALMSGAHQRVKSNCLRNNGQYGINAYKVGDTIVDLLVEGNEVVGNNTDDWESKVNGCGCTGGIKFWAVNGADIRGNWIHHNHGAALWADTNNNDFLIEGNLIEDNDGEALFYETSYNAVFRNNTVRRNNWVAGRSFADRGDNFPAATIYLSESGGEPRVPARTDKIDIYGNLFENNWSGITAWENADRFCNSPANTSTGSCTLLVAKDSQCAQPAIAVEPLLGDCRWKTQHVDVHNNRFVLKPTVVGCQTLCGRMAVLSNIGTFPDWSPYREDVVQEAITWRQDNRWHDNTYTGPWTFMPHDTGVLLRPPQWQADPYEQDRGSMFVASG